MRQTTQYSPEFKEKLLAKVFSPNAVSAVELAKQAGIPYPTLYTSIKMSKKAKTLQSGNASMRPKDKTAESKLQAVLDTLQMTKEEQSAYCRNQGFYTHHLDQWKKQILAGLTTASSKEQKSEQRQQSIEVKKLKSELNRKNKALAEASALLILKKKANLIWGVSEDD